MTNTLSATKKHYGEAFYQDQMTGSYRSAKHFVDHLWHYFSPSCVVDVGCGRGMWLKAFLEKGVTKAVGMDGPWNQQSNMAHPGIDFKPIDFEENPLEPSERFDLALSLEVAEHLAPQSARNFVQRLILLSDVVMFGAAYTAQGGTRHLNEQPNSYWAKLFHDNHYLVYDIFRPAVWDNNAIEFWYRQNTFLYVKENSAAHALLTSKLLTPLQNLSFCDCVHPQLFAYKLEPFSTAVLLRKLLKKLLRLEKRVAKHDI